MDWWGAGSLSLFLVFLTYFVSDGSAAGWTSPTALALLAGTVLSFAGFWFIEKRRSHPLIAVHHLRSRQVWPVIATTVLTLAGIFAVINFTVVLLSQDNDGGFGLSASISALLFLTPAALIGVFAAPLAGWLADLVSPEIADRVGKCWGYGSDTPKDPGPWEGELRNMWKPTNVPNLWIHGGNLQQNRHYSSYLALQLKARMEGLETPVYELQPSHHTR